MIRFLILSLMALALLIPTPALAMQPEADTAFVAPHLCIDRDELAGVLLVEGGNQPTADIIRMAQIVKAESEQRGITICALTRLTNFVSVRHYAQAHPESWTARNIDHPPEWMLDLAGAVLTDQYEDMRAGAGHFDGDGMHIIFRP